MPTYGNTDNLNDEERARVEAFSRAHQSFLQTCNPDDRAEMQRREIIALQSAEGGGQPSVARLNEIVRRALSVVSGPGGEGAPHSVEEQQETAKTREKERSENA